MRISNKRTLHAVGFVVLLIIIPITYLELIETFFPKSELTLIPGWEDNTFETVYQNAGWFDDSFEQGWKIVRTFNGNHNSSGLAIIDKTLILYSEFENVNEAPNSEISGVVVGKNFNVLNTTLFPFLVIKHRESSSNPALTFSFEVIDTEGIKYQGEWYHTSSNWIYLEFDLRKLFNGTIRSISLRLTNSFDHTYVGAVEYSYIELVAVYSSPTWKLAYNKNINAKIFSEDGILTVSGKGNLTKDTIITAERFDSLTFNPQEYRYMKVSIKTSSVTVAARVLLWENRSSASVLLLKTYNDTDWHKEIVDIPTFGFDSNSPPFLIELGIVLLDGHEQNYASASYKELSFNKGVIT